MRPSLTAPGYGSNDEKPKLSCHRLGREEGRLYPGGGRDNPGAGRLVPENRTPADYQSSG